MIGLNILINVNLIAMQQENTTVYLHTFDSDLDDVVCNAQVVFGRTAIVASISFIHIRNLQHFLEVMKGHPAARQFTSILLPGDLWSGSVMEAIINQLCLCAIFAFCFSFMKVLAFYYRAN